MTFGTFDIKRRFCEQGFQRGTYDVVITDNVLYVASGVSLVLRRVREVLKKGGKLIFHELLEPSGWTAGITRAIFRAWKYRP